MTDRPRRRHPAAASRVAALGLGTATMLGLVGAMTLAERADAVDQVPAAPPAPAPQIVVVVHQRDGSITSVPAGTTAAAPVAPVTPVAAVPVAGAAPTPVVLTAQPVVVAAPVASTHGSR